MKVHYLPEQLIAQVHPVTITLIGVGGTGSQVLNSLARINEALKAKGHPGLLVKAYDPDTVTEANIGRQMFSPADIGLNKATVLVTRLNRYFGLNWDACPEKYDPKLHGLGNFIISCIDTVADRLTLNKNIHYKGIVPRGDIMSTPYYWMDFGNSYNTGQVVMGTISPIKQPDSEMETIHTLPNVLKLLPKMKTMKDEDLGPSCSLAQALGRQDLFINSTLAGYGCNLIWKMLSEYRIAYHGVFVNLATIKVNPIKI